MPHSKVLEICCVLNVKSVGGVTDVPKEDDSLWLSCVVEGEFAAPGAELHPTLPSSTVQHKITERSLFISSHPQKSNEMRVFRQEHLEGIPDPWRNTHISRLL